MQHIIFVGENIEDDISRELVSSYPATEIVSHLTKNKLQELTQATGATVFLDGAGLNKISLVKEVLTTIPHKGTALLLRANPSNFSIVPAPSILFQEIGAETSNPIVAAVCEPAMVLMLLELMEDANCEIELSRLFLGLALLGLTPDFEVQMLPCIRLSAVESEQLTKDDRIFILKCIIELFNIEDIFPSLEWSSNPKQSAAHSYQLLASQFLLLGDNDAALECINISDQFMETARSYALRAVIASQKGETLAAVANMVTSLQQYEESAPLGSLNDQIECSVTSSLQDGLNALNDQNNQLALEKFTHAIAEYDPYFKEHRLLSLFTPTQGLS